MRIETKSIHGSIEIGLCYMRRSMYRKTFGRTEFSFKREPLDESACSAVMYCYCCSWIRLYFVDIFSNIGMQSQKTEKLCLGAVLAVDNLSDDIHHIMSEIYYLFLRRVSKWWGNHQLSVVKLSRSRHISILVHQSVKRHSYDKRKEKATMKYKEFSWPMNIMFHVVFDVNSLSEFIHNKYGGYADRTNYSNNNFEMDSQKKTVWY